ncbi:T9SS type A sorting domain-containing protein [Hymenobacter sp. GOD-10R]|uniref:T9SS type A sorting domain-containing protein n=1 Tax=Hymenobacter sp. GOD-10R TaxID=3093922 RepID=UPI002D79F5EA|nr:T9SS type A sorting domain-containing protein [Hymenobacter sp. GOD-10R]WRQ30665.1 T9SS type A sorting domain-containing protein [Hymenobacter sp. GOD-10R]
MNVSAWRLALSLVNLGGLLCRAAMGLLLLGGSFAVQAQAAWQTTYSFPGGAKTGIAATGDSTLITAVATGIMCTNNQGRTWQLALRAHFVEVVYATRSGELLAGGLGKVYRSFNAGASWDSVRLTTSYPITTFAETPQGQLLLGTGAYTTTGSIGSGVYFSADKGFTWQVRNTGFGTGRYVNQLTVDRQGRVYAAVADQNTDHQPGLYVSGDNGQLWRYLPLCLRSPDFTDPVNVLEVTALAVSPQDSLQCSFSGSYATIGVMGNFTKSVAEAADPSIGWTVRGGTSAQNWWFRPPLNHLYFAANGTWYSSRTGTPSFGGTLVSQDRGHTWGLLNAGLGVSIYGLHEPQQFAELPDGKLFMVQNLDPLVYWATSVVTANRPQQEQAQVQLYPNPATDLVHIVNNTHQPLRAVTLTDLGGRLVRRLEPSATALAPTLDLRELTAGVYVATLTLANGHVVRQRVVKQ